MVKKIFILSIVTLLCVSCSDDFLERPPKDVLTDANFWETEEHLILAANALYGNIKSKNTVDMENMGGQYTLALKYTISSNW